MSYVSVSGLTKGNACDARSAGASGAEGQTEMQRKMLEAIRRVQATTVADEGNETGVPLPAPEPVTARVTDGKPLSRRRGGGDGGCGAELHGTNNNRSVTPEHAARRVTVPVTAPPMQKAVPQKRVEPVAVPMPQATSSFRADNPPDIDALPPLSELVHVRLRKPLTELLHITELTRIQKLSWGAMTDRGRDVLLRSETGSGKTLAYALPTLHVLLTACDADPIRRDVGTLVIIMCPTRELVLQVCDTVTTLLRAAPFLTVGGVHGGENRHREKARLRKGIPILVTTPGRLLDHLKATNAFVVRGLQTIVMDEADRLLDLGFEKAIREIMELLASRCASPESLKRILVSATITAGVERLSHFTLRPAVTRVGETEDTFTVPATLRQHFVVVPTKHRLAVLLSFLRSQFDAGASRVVVFVSTADSAEFLYYLVSRLPSPFRRHRGGGAADYVGEGRSGEMGLRQSRSGKRVKKLTEMANQHLTDTTQSVVTFDEDDDAPNDEDNEDGSSGGNGLAGPLQGGGTLLDVNVFKLHGNMSQVDRASVFRAFKHGVGPDAASAKGLLFCTDVAARGLDMPEVNWIVHYDPPSDPTSYIHRVGRTARIGHSGDSILFLAPHEAGYAAYLTKFVSAQGGGVAATAMSEKKFETFLFYLTKLDPAANHMWSQSTAALERAICRTVMHSAAPGQDADDLSRIALFAYQSYIRAYAGISRAIKAAFFPSSALHLGHVAQSFGIDKSPSEVQRQLQSYIRADRVLARDNRKGMVNATSGAASSATTIPAGRAKRQRIELEHDDRYHSMLAQKQRKLTRDWAERRRETSTKIKPLQFTEFDA